MYVHTYVCNVYNTKYVIVTYTAIFATEDLFYTYVACIQCAVSSCAIILKLHDIISLRDGIIQ